MQLHRRRPPQPHWLRFLQLLLVPRRPLLATASCSSSWPPAPAHPAARAACALPDSDELPADHDVHAQLPTPLFSRSAAPVSMQPSGLDAATADMDQVFAQLPTPLFSRSAATDLDQHATSLELQPLLSAAIETQPLQRRHV